MKKILLSGRSPISRVVAMAEKYQAANVFGFSYLYSPLYGGRSIYAEHALSKDIIDALESKGISFSITLSSHFFSEAQYEQSLPLLQEHYKPGNSVTVLNTKLAQRIRADFPDYILKASCIREPRTLEAVSRALDIFDEVVIHPQSMRNPAFIRALPEKNRIILFGGIGCLLDCSDTVCFAIASKVLAGDSKRKKGCPKLNSGYVSPFYWFDWENSPLFDGFNTIKLELPQDHQMQVRLPPAWPLK